MFEGQDVAESDQEVITISEDGDNMGGESVKEESSKEGHNISDGDESEEDSECPKSSESELEVHG